MTECLNPFRILLVDDEERVLGALKRTIGQVDPCIQLLFAHGGEEAIKVSKEDKFDLVISDLRMPRMDGNRVLGFVRRNHPESFRVILSGQASIKSLLQALPVSHQYLEKPCPSVRITNLISVLAKLRNSKLPPALLNQVLTISSLPCDGEIHSLLRQELEQGRDPQRLNTLFCSDLGISLGLLRLTAVTCGGKLPIQQPLNTSNLPSELLHDLLDSPLLAPFQHSEEILRAIRLVSIKSNLLKQQLALSGTPHANLLGILGYLGELILIHSLGSDAETLVRFISYRDKIAELLWILWAMPEEALSTLSSKKFNDIRSKVDFLFPMEEVAQISNAEILEIYSEVLCLTDLLVL